MESSSQSRLALPSFLKTRQHVLHDSKCAGCEEGPIWGACFFCHVCDLTLCSRCLYRLPHDATHAFLRLPGSTVEISVLQDNLRAKVAAALEESEYLKLLDEYAVEVDKSLLREEKDSSGASVSTNDSPLSPADSGTEQKKLPVCQEQGEPLSVRQDRETSNIDDSAAVKSPSDKRTISSGSSEGHRLGQPGSHVSSVQPFPGTTGESSRHRDIPSPETGTSPLMSSTAPAVEECSGNDDSEGNICDISQDPTGPSSSPEERSNIDESQLQRNVKHVFGLRSHPLAHLIPPSLVQLSPSATSEQNVAFLIQALPDVTGQRTVERNQSLSGLLKLFAETAVEESEHTHILHLAELLIDVLCTPMNREEVSPGRGVDITFLPPFLHGMGKRGDEEMTGHYARQVLLCTWLTSLHEQGFEDLGEGVLADLMAIEQGEASVQRIEVNACAIGGQETVYCVPLLQMRQTSIPPRQQECVVNRVDRSSSGPYTTIFVSHAWRAKAHPDPCGEDWKVIQLFLWKAIALVVDTISVFLSIGVRRDVLGHQLNIARSEIVNSKHPSGGLISEALLNELLDRVMKELPADENLTKSVRKAWCRRVAEVVQVWFDFSSLPQLPRTPEEDILFRQTLSNLADIQLAMHTLTVDPESGYMNRAWCAAEWLLGGGVSTPFGFEGEDELRSDVLPLGPLRHALRLSAFCALVDGEFGSSEEVLKNLELTITNGKSDSEIVCRILWESARLAPVSPGLHFAREDRVILASGTVNEVKGLLESVHTDLFSRDLFERLPGIRRNRDDDCGVGSKSTRPCLTIYWLFHEPVVNLIQEPFIHEDTGMCLRRDVLGLLAVISAIEESPAIRVEDVYVRAGITKTTTVKREDGVILCGFSCEDSVLDVGDIVIPMKGSSGARTLFRNMLSYSRAMNRWMDEASDSSTASCVESESVSGASER